MSSTRRTIVDLFVEEFDHGDNPSDAEIIAFPIVAGMQEELIELIKQKIVDSVQLQRFILEKEIEFKRKFIALLTAQDDPNRLNNHNELEELCQLDMSTEERARALEEVRNELNGLEIKMRNLEKRQRKACENLSSGAFDQLRIFNESTTNSFKRKGRSWTCSVNNSLHQMRMMCEKLLGTMSKMELNYWITEITSVIGKLTDNEKVVAIEIILEMITWFAETNPSAETDNNLISLLITLLECEDLNVLIVPKLDELSVVEDGLIEKYMLNITLFSSIFQRTKVVSIREVWGVKLCEQMVRVLEHVDLTGPLMIQVTEVFGSVQQDLGGILTRFDNISALFTAKSSILEGAHLVQFNEFMIKSFPVVDPVPIIPLITNVDSFLPPPNENLRRSSSQSRLFRVTEIPDSPEMQSPDYWQRREEELRREVEEKLRIEELKRLEEQEKERRMREEIEEEYKRKEKERERIRKAEEEERRERRRKEEEEERRRKAEEEEIRRKKDEEERKKKAEEAENARKAAEERDRQLQRDRNRCRFLNGVTLLRHKFPNKTYNQNVLNGKIIGLYFSGHWCPPSRDFTPILKDFYGQVEEDMEIVFISWDNNQQEMDHYLNQYHGDWFHLSLGDQAGVSLKNQLSVTSIPTLIIIKPDGNVITNDGRNQVTSFANNPQEIVKWWKQP